MPLSRYVLPYHVPNPCHYRNVNTQYATQTRVFFAALFPTKGLGASGNNSEVDILDDDDVLLASYQ